jgi:uncharacterized LabA/DUF88 family protein
VNGREHMTNQAESQESIPRRVRVYIDAFNMYHAIDALGDHALKWVNLRRLSEGLLRSGEILTEVNFFTAVLTWNHEKQQRHRNYLAALQAVGVTIHEANFKTAIRICPEFGHKCKFREEKQTDVAIAVKLVADALQGQVDRAILVTADSDQIPAARFVQSLPNVSLSLVFPPRRRSHARELGSIIPDRLELTEGRLRNCPLPRTVFNSVGKAVAHMPAMYLTPRS